MSGICEAAIATAGKYLKPYQGLKHLFATYYVIVYRYHAGKYLKPYQGLKLDFILISKNLTEWAGKYLKPYQGLKLSSFSTSHIAEGGTAGKYLKPYQGLKP